MTYPAAWRRGGTEFFIANLFTLFLSLDRPAESNRPFSHLRSLLMNQEDILLSEIIINGRQSVSLVPGTADI